MRRMILGLGLAAFAVFFAGDAEALTYRYSTDLGSDLDLSDPVSTANNWMDCGDVYRESAPTLVKDDNSPGVYPGYPFGFPAPQPAPALIGSAPSATPAQVRNVYQQYFDLDGEDQLGLEVYLAAGAYSLIGWTRPELAAHGIHLEPKSIALSYDDDNAPGWYKSGQIPTTSAPDRAVEVFAGTGPFGAWVVSPVRDEVALGLSPNPPAQANDDDVDALDVEEHRWFYWSPDHEANLGFDPGGVYMTDLSFATGPNWVQVVHDVYNIGVTQDTDVDAFEFCSVTYDTYLDLFPNASPPIDPNAEVLVMLFSVDNDDIDTGLAPFNNQYGDESGGLNPNAIYLTNLAGSYVLLNVYDDDIDALTVIPEPATLSLFAVAAGLALLRRRAMRR